MPTAEHICICRYYESLILIEQFPKLPLTKFHQSYSQFCVCTEIGKK